MTDAYALPPQNVEAEQWTLGAMLLDNAAIDDVAAILEPGDFYRDLHATVYRTILDLRDRGLPADMVTLDEELRRQGLFRDGDRAAMDLANDLLGSVPHAASAAYHAAIVRDKAQRRRLLAAHAEMLAACYRHDDATADLIAESERRIFAVGEAEATGSTREIAEHAAEAMARLARRRAGEFAGIATGLADLDELTDGLHGGQLVVLAARPSIGKTAMALNILEYASFNCAVPVLFVSLEMAGVELAERLIVSRSRVEGHRVRTGEFLTPQDDRAIARAVGEIDACGRLWVDDAPFRTVAQIAANARRHRARLGVGLVAVDYIQLIEPGSDVARKASRQEQVAAISRRLKALAKEIDVPVLALAQLNRQAETREDRRPRLSDLRESGAIEQDADIVLLLHRPEFYDPDDRPGEAEVIVAKNRNGRTGSVRLTFIKGQARFVNFFPEALAGDGEAY